MATSCCMIMRGSSGDPCPDAKIIDELITEVDKDGDLISIKYLLSDGSLYDAAGKSPQDLLKMNILLHQNIAQSLIEMLENKTTPRVKLTCNGEPDISIPHFLIKLGFRLVTTHPAKKQK